MLANQCDATIGLPQDSDFMGPRVIFSKPLFKLGYAIVAPKDFEFTGLSSLVGKRVILQFSTTPHNMIGPREDIAGVTVLSPEEGMQKLADGKADVAVLWGAHAGYLNTSVYGDRYKLISIDGPGLQWPTAIGFAKDHAELRDEVDTLLPGMKDAIAGLMTKYGLPTDQPVKLGALASGQRVRVAAIGESAFLLAQAAQATPQPSAPASTAVAPANASSSKSRRRQGSVQRHVLALPWTRRHPVGKENRPAPPFHPLRRRHEGYLLENRARRAPVEGHACMERCFHGRTTKRHPGVAANRAIQGIMKRSVIFLL